MILTFTSNAPGASTLSVISETVDTGFVLLSGATFGSPVWEHTFSAPRGTQGARASQGRLPNRQVQLPIRCAGATKDALAAQMKSLASAVDDMRRYGGTVRMRSKSQTYAQSFEVVTASIDLPTWDNRLEQRFRGVVMVNLVCGPYVLADPYDFDDEYLTDNVNGGALNYTASGGALTNLAVSGGALNGAVNLTTENRILYTGSGLALGDHEAIVRFSPGATINGFKVGVILKWIDASNYLIVYVDDNGVNSRLRADKVVAGVTTNIASNNLAARVRASMPGSVRGRIEGNKVTTEYLLETNLGFESTATLSSGVYLSGADITKFGATVTGKSGIVFIPQGTDAYIDRFTVLPYTSRSSQFIQTTHLRGSIIGDAPAVADLWAAATGPLPSALFAWAPTSNPNRLQNGGFDAISGSVVPWQVSAVAGVTGAATSIAQAGSPKFGNFTGLVTTPATANVGATYPIYQNFVQGVTYTARAWLRSNASTTLARIRLGVSGDIQSSTAVALSSTWTLHTVTWSPTLPVQVAYLAVEQTAATAGTISIDGAAVYEGTTAPTYGTHIEGSGGFSALAAISGADNVYASANLVTTNDAGSAAVTGWAMADTSVLAAGESYETRHMISPGLIGPDDYSADDVAVEVWVRVYLHTTFTGGGTLLARTMDAAGNVIDYTAEYGSTGKAFATPTTNGYRTFRLGTLRINVTEGARWFLSISATINAGTNLQKFAIGDVIVVPARNRSTTPTGKSATGYPSFFPFTGVQTKFINSADLSGSLVRAGSREKTRASGLGGSPIELPPGPIDFLAMVLPKAVESDTSAETSYISPDFHLSVTPRFHWMRDA